MNFLRQYCGAKKYPKITAYQHSNSHRNKIYLAAVLAASTHFALSASLKKVVLA